MKKLISTILALSFAIGIFSVLPTNAAKNVTDDIQSFVNESRELLLYETEPVFATSSVEDDECSDINFSSCRLILKATKKPNKLNSVGIADGFKDYYIIQFKNEIDTREAYEYYSEKDYVTNIGVDEEQNALTSIDSLNSIDLKNYLNSTSNLMAVDVPTYDGVPDRLNSWGSEAVGAYAVKDYIMNNDLFVKEKVTVAVIDSGIEYDHEYFSNKQYRIEKTGFTTVSSPNNDEYDNFVGHGTAVTSVILDSTPDNVIVRNYKISDDEYMTMTDATTAMLQAVVDGVNIINCSFAFTTMNKNLVGYELFEEAIQETYEKGVLIVCSAGNIYGESVQPAVSLPATSNYVISVSGLTPQFRATFSPGWTVDVTAPAVDIPVAYLGSYSYLSGTSFSSPMTASVCASMLILHPDYVPEDFIDIVKETAIPYDDYMDLEGINNLYGTGIVDAIEATGIERPQKVVSNLEGGKYEGEITLTFTAPDGGAIYYTKNGNYPTPENGTLYSEPIQMYSDADIIYAATYDENGVSSRLFTNLYRSSVLEDESKFEIDENGTITVYNGNLLDIIIPETINDIEVKNIAYSAFADKMVIGLTLPKTITTLGDFTYNDKGAFFEHQYLLFIDGEFVEEIGHDVFNSCKQLVFANFPNCKKLGDGTFLNNNAIKQLKLPKVESIGIETFMGDIIYYLCLPELKSCAADAFSQSAIYNLYAPEFTYINDEERITYPQILYRAKISSPLDWGYVEDLRFSLFGYINGGYSLYRIEFSKLKALYDMPSYGSSLALPSTLEILPETFKEEYGSYFNSFKIYGSKGTKVEEWAIKHDLNFIEVTPSTAVITDLPKYYKSYMGDLMADVVGFNKEYQWYANDINSNEGGTPIEGATDMYFDPATYPDAKYYYCEVISKDGDFEPITIKTSACENRMEVVYDDIPVNSIETIEQAFIGSMATVKVNVDKSPDEIRFVDNNRNTITVKKEDATIITDHSNGTEDWWIKLYTNEIQKEYSVFAKYTDTGWNENSTKFVFRGKTLETQEEIYSVELPDGQDFVIYQGVNTVKIITNTETSKVQFYQNGNTWTYNQDNATVTETDGQKEWIINMNFCSLGDNLFSIRTRTPKNTFTIVGQLAVTVYAK